MGTHPIFESDFDCLTVEMSDSDSDDEFKELFDAFDQLHEEDTTTAAVCTDNNELHGAKFDPYAPKQSLREAEQSTIDSLKRKRIFDELNPQSSQPSKVARTGAPAKSSRTTMQTGISRKPTMGTGISSKPSTSKTEMETCPLSGLRYRSFEKGMNLAQIQNRIDESGAKFVHLNSIASNANKDLVKSALGAQLNDVKALCDNEARERQLLLGKFRNLEHE